MSEQDQDTAAQKLSPPSESGDPIVRRVLVLLDPVERGWLLVVVAESGAGEEPQATSLAKRLLS